jgi:hypothetical protein
MGVAQIPTLVKWGVYLEGLVAILGPLEFTSGEVDDPDVGQTLVHIRRGRGLYLSLLGVMMAVAREHLPYG